MGKRKTRHRFDASSGEMMAAYSEYREDELLDAVATAAALSFQMPSCSARRKLRSKSRPACFVPVQWARTIS